jgi:hypothetical protein
MIVIHTAVSLNSLKYYEFLRNNYTNLSSGKYPITYKAYCLDAKSFHKLKKSEFLKEVIYCGDVKGSYGHALAIDQALKTLTPNSINIISDTDVAIVFQNWDCLLFDLLNENAQCSVLGTQLEPIGGFSSGYGKFQQYKQKPTTTWLAISPRYDFKNLSVLPDKSTFNLITNKQDSLLYNLPIGYSLVKDTGWQIPEYLNDNKFPYEVLDIVSPKSSNALVLKGISEYHDEFHYRGKPFLVHQRGSMTHKFRVDPLSKHFYNSVEEYLGFPNWVSRPGFVDVFNGTARRYFRSFKKHFKAIKNNRFED